ncbi:outer membrane beta-barrel protein [Acetobacter sacchari]|nr:outer membrane beta-barrel protein [Acetobacter sacchari]
MNQKAGAPTLAAACGIAFFMLPLAANAQVIQNYFPALGSGAGELSTEPTQVKAARAYQAQGFQSGPVIVNLDGSEGGGYDSNVDMLPAAHSSAVINTQGHLSVVSRFPHNDQVHGDISVSDTRYPSRAVQNRTTWTANVGGTHYFGRDELGFSYTHLSLVQMPSEAGALILSSPVPYTVEDGRISYLVHTHGRASFQPFVEAQRYAFGRPATVNNAGAYTNQTYRNRVVINEGVTSRYELMAETHLLVVAQGTEIRYDTPASGYPSRNSNGFSILGGYDAGWKGPIKFRALLGYQMRRYASTLYGKITSPVAEAQLSWEPTRLTSAVLSVRHGIEDSAFEGVVGFTNTAASLVVTHALQRNVLLTFNAQVNKASYPATPAALKGTPVYQVASDQNTYGFGLSGQVFLNRHLSVTANYSYLSQSVYQSAMFPVHMAQLSVHFAL